MLYRSLSLLLTISVLMACSSSKNLLTVLVEDKTGNVELVYVRSQSTENLVREVRYAANGDTLSVTPMKKGAVHGTVSHYHPGNRLKEQVPFENGVQQGQFKRYDKDGVLVFEGQLVNGKKNGIWTTWYDEVQVMEEQQFVNDLPDGKWTYYFIDGNVKREEVYQLGKLIEEKNHN